MARAAVTAVALVLVSACATSADDGASTGGGDPRSSRDRAESRPGEQWVEVTLCSSIGPVRVEMPGPVRFEGPRPLAHIAEPSRGTFAVSYGSTDDRRYDAFVLDHLGEVAARRGHDGRAELLTDLLPELDGDPTVVDLGTVEAVGDHHEVAYEETFNDRRMDAHAFAFAGVVIVVNVGVRHGSSAEDLAIARDDLQRLRATIDLPDPDDVGSCRPGEAPLTDDERPGGDRPVPEDV